MSRRMCQLFLLYVCLLAGCQKLSATKSTAETKDAEDALSAALDAWKTGQIKALLKRERPIRFVDDDLVSGLKLADFKIHSAKQQSAQAYVVIVDLSLKDRSGRAFERQATYQIGLSPNLSVLRSDS